MSDNSREGQLAALGCLAFLGAAFLNLAFCFGMGWIASLALSAFYPHDYPLWGFALAVFLILWVIRIPSSSYRRKDRPKLSSSDNRYNPNNW